MVILVFHGNPPLPTMFLGISDFTYHFLLFDPWPLAKGQNIKGGVRGEP